MLIDLTIVKRWQVDIHCVVGETYAGEKGRDVFLVCGYDRHFRMQAVLWLNYSPLQQMQRWPDHRILSVNSAIWLLSYVREE